MQPEAEFRPLNKEFLDRNGDQCFDLYVKTVQDGESKFVKFAGKASEHQAKVRQLLKAGALQEDLFFHQDDRDQYFSQVSKRLKKLVDNDRAPLNRKVQKIYGVSKELMQEFFDYNASDSVLGVADEVLEMMEGVVSESGQGFACLAEHLVRDYYVYTHSVNVAMYCISYGIQMKMNKADIHALGLGGMFHDLGLSRIPDEIIYKKGSLDEEETRKLQEHPKIGLEILKGMNRYGLPVMKIVAQHHENCNGTGYPKGSSKKDISLLSRICKVADVYDSLVSPKKFRRAMSTMEALTEMTQNMRDTFDLEIIRNFIVLLGPTVRKG
jgi:HD-GYP domain-containing protein (c-di-GMP phosphodiesterase class II)